MYLPHQPRKYQTQTQSQYPYVNPPRRPHPLSRHYSSIPPTSSSSHLLGPTSPTSGPKTRTRRSMSSDSYGFNGEMPAIKELTSGQKKAAEDKKGSRHADVIDTWDPTGLGSAMWHHSGPYDAAAPSRNTNLPNNRAPMQAFRAPPVQSPPPKGPTTISLSSPPVPPAKDTTVEGSDRPAHKRGQSGNRYGAPPTNRRVSGGGLTGQYSTSMPSSGGYFPNMDAPQDEATLARLERQREREAKRQALKAAWGTDTPEPFEDFGRSPNDGTIDFSAPLPGKSARSPGLRFGMGATSPPILDQGTSPTGEYPPAITRGAGPGGVKRTKSLMQKIKTMVRHRSESMESDSNPPFRYGYGGGEGQRSMSASSGQVHKGKVPLPSPGWEDRPALVEEEELEDEIIPGGGQFDDADVFGHDRRRVVSDGNNRENPRSSSPNKASSNEINPSISAEHPSEYHQDKSKRPGFFARTSGNQSSSGGRNSPNKKPILPHNSFSNSSIPTTNSITTPNDVFAEVDESLKDNLNKQGNPEDFEKIIPSTAGSGFILVESPSSKARVLKALQKEQQHNHHHHHHVRSNSHSKHDENGISTIPANRAKYLPTPPVAPVMPDFNDILAPTRKTSPMELGVPEEGGLKRKTSMVKKLKDRMNK
uniref:Pal1 cell morphology protein n=1 Tax=Kwoniella pini CBS 10737 TaxID=1296096 RepID=A0A1B9IAM7_9TREE|nr:uncharacterized protein I206_01770 [Kwoniella pini CBS 10737]OCF52480.1 hypothetical protein I206_01770 [Kwoniella pini CBS 10737]